MRARLFACALALLVPACSSSNSTEVTGPSAVKCEVTVENALAGPAPASGTSSTFNVSTTRDCTWNATSDSAWLTITGGGTGQGSGRVSYSVAANAQPAQRRAIVNVSSSQITVMQDGAPCQFTVAPANPTMAATGGKLTLTVQVLSGCSWTVQSNASWITASSGATGNGNGTIALDVAANTGDARTGSIAIGGTTVTVSQTAAPCGFSVTPLTENVPFAGGGVNLAVAVRPGCTWTAATTTAWIAVPPGSAGNGDGTVAIQVAANAGDARSGSVTIAGATVTISQAAAPCTFNVTPTTQNVPAAGGPVNVAVAVRPGCAWTAAGGASWIAVASGTSGNGNGTVVMQVAANGGDARSATLTIAGTTVTIAQAAAPCTFTLAPTGQNVPVEGASGSVSVGVRPGCPWTAASSVSWVTITSAAGGTGPGVITFVVAPNPGPPRNTTLTIAGLPFSVSQSTVPCDYSIGPRTQFIGPDGGTGTTTIVTGPTCPWDAVPNVPWITMISAASGIGPAQVVFAIGANPGDARSGTVTVAGQAYTVFQDARR